MNRKGVSVLVGFILLMMTLMLFLALLQTQMIPSICKDVELKNLNEITEELEALDRSIIEDKMTAIPFDLGVRYPRYPFLLSPPTMAAQVIAEPIAIDVSYDEILPNGSIIHRTLHDTSDSITIRLNYFYNRGYEMNLENTAIFRVVSDRALKICDQQIFTQGGIKIPFVNATFNSFSSSQPVNIAVVPVSYGGYVLAKNVTVNFTTRFPDYWRNISSELTGLGYTVTVNGNDVSIRFSNVTRLEMSYVLLFKGVSISALQYSNVVKPEPVRMIPTNPTMNYTLNINGSLILGVKVVDRFNNPVGGVPTSITLNGVGEVKPNFAYTNSYGEVFTIYTANETGSATVNFSTSFAHVVYRIEVLKTTQTALSTITYDANSSTPGEVYAYGNYTREKPPSTNDIPNDPLPTTNITSDDGRYLVSRASEYYSAQRFVFTGLSTDNVLITDVFWNGYGIGYVSGGGCMKSKQSNGVSIYVWNYNTSSYDLVGYTTTSSEGWLTATIFPSTLRDYVRNGEMIILVVQNGNYDSELYTDYIGVLQIK